MGFVYYLYFNSLETWFYYQNMIGNHLFKIYSAVSLIVPVWIVAVAVSEHKTTFSTLVDLTSFKLNLLIFFNGVMVLLILFSNFLTWLFFGDIRIIE